MRSFLHVHRWTGRLLCTPGIRLSLHKYSRRSSHHYHTVRKPLTPSVHSHVYHCSSVLTNNEIADLPSGAFSHLPALEDLQLDNNQLSSLSPQYFDSLPNLRRLLVQQLPISLYVL